MNPSSNISAVCIAVAVFLSLVTGGCRQDVVPGRPTMAQTVEKADGPTVILNFTDGKWAVRGKGIDLGGCRTFASARSDVYGEWCDVIDEEGRFLGVLIFEADGEQAECWLNWRLSKPVYFQFEVGTSTRIVRLGDGYGNEHLRLH